MQLSHAEHLYDAAHEWPRCGQAWPATADEEAAEALLAPLRPTEEQEAASEAAYMALLAKRSQARETAAAARREVVAAACPSEKTSATLAAFAAAVPALRVEEAEAVGFGSIAIMSAEKKGLVVITRHGQILPKAES